MYKEPSEVDDNINKLQKEFNELHEHLIKVQKAIRYKCANCNFVFDEESNTKPICKKCTSNACDMIRS